LFADDSLEESAVAHFDTGFGVAIVDHLKVFDGRSDGERCCRLAAC
jgi:hypothetical protein